jgi:hypothetical protein
MLDCLGADEWAACALRLQRASAIVSRHVGADPALGPYARTSGGGDDA